MTRTIAYSLPQVMESIEVESGRAGSSETSCPWRSIEDGEKLTLGYSLKIWKFSFQEAFIIFFSWLEIW